MKKSLSVIALLLVLVSCDDPVPSSPVLIQPPSTRELAEQGNARAQTMLGYMYAEGTGVPQDDAEALKWYRLAAEQEGGFAQFALGEMYSAGRGVP